MKRRIIIIVFCVTIIFVAFNIIGNKGDVRMLENLDITTLNKVTITGPMTGDDDGIEITKQADIKNVVDLLQSMHLDKTNPIDRDGYLCTVDLYYENGDTSWITIRGDIIAIDNTYYTCDRDYCDDFRKLYEELSG